MAASNTLQLPVNSTHINQPCSYFTGFEANKLREAFDVGNWYAFVLVYSQVPFQHSTAFCSGSSVLCHSVLFCSAHLLKGDSHIQMLHGTPKGMAAPMDGVNMITSLFISF